MKNKEIARIFDRIADALEFQGANRFRVVAYRKAARILDDLTEDVSVLAQANKLESLPGIGHAIATKIAEYLSTGTVKKYEEVKKEIPGTLLDLLDIQNLGPKTLALAYKELGVESLKDLKQVIKNGRLEELPQMGKQKVDNIRKGIVLYERAHERLSIAAAEEIARELIAYLKKETRIKHISAAGSLRRWKETIGDIDILATGPNSRKIITVFTQFPNAERVLAAGTTKSSILVRGGVQVDLRIVNAGSYGAALQYFTGSKAHNIRLRNIAKSKGLKLSEYGVFRGKKQIAGRNERDVYKILGLIYVPPEIREDRGEVELALENKLPKLVEHRNIRGDLHMHSTYSDSEATIAELATAADALGYEYILITDHSQSVTYAHGVEPKRLYAQWKEIDRLNKKLRTPHILKGVEVDIRRDGTLDYPDAVLKECDFVVAAIHQGFKHKVTERMCRAMQNPYVDIIAHPTGRLISSREGYHIDLHRVMEVAAETGTWLEINAYWDRLDLNDTNARAAHEQGVSMAIGTDAHDIKGLQWMKFGVATARRAWLASKDVVNTYTLKKLRAARKVHRKDRIL